MAIAQTGITSMEPGMPGLVADTDLGKKTASRVNAEASAEMRFGIMVAEGAGEAEALLLAANDDQLAGVVVHSHWYHKDLELGDNGLKPKATIGVLQRGTIWVEVEGTLPTKASEVHVRAVAAGAEVAGRFRATKDGTDTIDITGLAQWTGRTGTGIAELTLDIANRGLAVADT